MPSRQSLSLSHTPSPEKSLGDSTLVLRDKQEGSQMFLFQKCFSEHLSHQAGHRALNVKAVEPL